MSARPLVKHLHGTLLGEQRPSYPSCSCFLTAGGIGENGIVPEDPGAVDAADNWDMTLAVVANPTTTPEFMVPRSAATFEGTAPNRKMVLTVDLSDADCRTGGDANANKCGIGKYLVTGVTAHPLSGTGTATSDASAWKQFTFVGELPGCLLRVQA